MKMKSLQDLTISDFIIFLLTFVVIVLPDIKPIYIGVQVLFFMVMFITHKNYKIDNKYFFWILILSSYVFFSSIWAIKPLTSLRSTISLVQVLLIGFCIVIYIENISNLKFILKSFIIAAHILILRLLLTQPLSVIGTERMGSSIGYNSNIIGLILVFAGLFSYFYGEYIHNKVYVYFAYYFIFISLFTGSRKSLVLALLGILFLKFLLFKEKVTLKTVFSTGILIIVALFFIFKNPTIYELLGKRIEGFFGAFTENTQYIDSSTETRISLMNQAINVIKSNFLLGVGTDNFRFLNTFNTYAHMNYLEVFADFGLIGFIIYYSYLFYLLIYNFMRDLNKDILRFFSFFILFTCLILDFAMVSYNLELTHILIALSVSLTRISDRKLLRSTTT